MDYNEKRERGGRERGSLVSGLFVNSKRETVSILNFTVVIDFIFCLGDEDFVVGVFRDYQCLTGTVRDKYSVIS